MDWDPADRSAKANYHFLTSAVAPRPIAWVTTVSGAGAVNLAPFSWFQAVCADPPMLMLALADRPEGGPKDTLRNIGETGEFVVHPVTRDDLEPMVASSGAFSPEASELEALGLASEASSIVAPPRLAGSPVALECRLVSTQRLGGPAAPTTLVLGKVVHVHADDGVLDERGDVDPRKAVWLARLGGAYYTAVAEVFEHRRPTQDAVRGGG